MDNEFYDRIVYKKNAFAQMQEDLQKYYFGKKALIITTKSLINNNFTEIMNSTSLAGLYFETFVAKNNFSEFELRNLSEILTQTNFDILIVYGGGRASDVAKYFANIFCIPFFMCPSACSTFAYFTNVCINPYDPTRSFTCDGAERVYIAESAIKTTPRQLVKQGVYSIMGTLEMICMATIENILFDKTTNYGELNKCLLKLKKELPEIMSGEIDSKLVVMDILIDVANCLTKVDMFNISSFNLYLLMQKIVTENSQVIGGGELLMLSTKTLLECYKNLFMQKKIKQVELPNFSKIAKNVQKYGIFCKKINNFAYFSQILSKNELLIRLNNLKEEFLFQTNKCLNFLEEFTAIIKKYEEIFTFDSPNFSNIFTATSLLPFVCNNNYVVSLMGGIGILNNF